MGITTFLFTDLEGSTRLWALEPERMRAALALHDAILRNAVTSNHGIVVKMSGDGIHAAFEEPRGAVNAAIAIQQALADPSATNGLALPVRCGVHIGDAERRDGDFFGDAVNRAARIMGAAHGGQVLLSRAVVDLAGEPVASGMSFRDLGRVRLRDLTSPEWVYQLVHPALRREFPALRSLEAIPNNLPLQPTPFIGRAREAVEVTALLRGTRMLTLVGMGGMGKTRLSLQVAADVMDDYPDGVWLAELAQIADSRLVPQAVASALGIGSQLGRTVSESLAGHLEDRRTLLVLDNCEHLAAACAQLSALLLGSAPQVKILATSREPLQIGGETTYPLAPLRAPESAHLFTSRATAAQPGFRAGTANAAVIASICSRLDGIPLALELAAARVRVLTVEKIDERLGDRFGLLVGGDRTARPHQQTLRAMVDWSHELLTDRERMLFRRLAVFAGGWTLEAAETVCAEGEIEGSEVLDLLGHLVEKSLVTLEPEVGRYRMLETVRQYALERLRESGEETSIANRHCIQFVAVAEEASRNAFGADQRRKHMDVVRFEIDNLRAALEWSLAPGAGDTRSLRLCAALFPFWLTMGLGQEGLEWIVRALERASHRSSREYVAALRGAGVLAAQHGDPRAAKARYNAALALSREMGDQDSECRILSNLGLQATEQRDFTAASTHLAQGLAIAKAREDAHMQAAITNNLAYAATIRGDLTSAHALRTEALVLCNRPELRGDAARSLNGLGWVAQCQGDFEAARAFHQRALGILEDLGGDEELESFVLRLLGTLASRTGDYPAARAALMKALAGNRRNGSHFEVASCLDEVAMLAAALRSDERPARLWGAADALREARGSAIAPVECDRIEASRSRCRAALGGTKYDAVYRAGRCLAPQSAVDEALDCLEDLT